LVLVLFVNAQLDPFAVAAVTAVTAVTAVAAVAVVAVVAVVAAVIARHPREGGDPGPLLCVCRAELARLLLLSKDKTRKVAVAVAAVAFRLCSSSQLSLG
jgi:hypothetical protein